ncbi:MAG: hypothetical protein AUH72_12660 [Acidobacteria bacterium 13_1_40CM_4_65_8]|nr:MAG: hypothetical protein AUH72_12660 [Acidobacteria bacterium 13_1_40CM_4_65_8]
MPDDVVREDDVLDGRPGRATILIAHREEDGKAVLGLRPVVLEQVTVNEHAPGVLELEQVLDGPFGAGERLVTDLPRHRFRQVILADLDVGGHEIANGGIGAAEHDVLAGSFEVAVGDLERAVAVPAGDRLRVGAAFLEVRQVRVDDSRLPRVHRDAPTAAARRVPVQVAAVEDEMVRQRLHADVVVPELHERVEEDAVCRGDVQTDEAIMMGAAVGGEHGAGRGDELRHDRRVRRVDPASLCREARQRRRDDDPAGPFFRRQMKRAAIHGACLQRDQVAAPRLVERPLQVATGGHVNRVPPKRRKRRVDEGPRRLGRSRRARHGGGRAARPFARRGGSRQHDEHTDRDRDRA